MKKHIGYTSELFVMRDDRIYKYTNDSARISFMKEQMNHLKLIASKDSIIAPRNIEWHEEPGRWGYLMEYIDNAERIEDYHLPQVFELINVCANLQSDKEIPSFTTYINYLKDVINKNTDVFEKDELDLLQKYYDTLKKYTQDFDLFKSTSHGDFTMENILVSGDRLVLIDPIYKEGMWSSWLQDIAKFYQNIYFNDMKKTFEFSQLVPKNEYPEIFRLIHLLMIANYIRMFPYIKKNFIVYYQRYAEFQILLKFL